jgi:hypothetical protein
MAWTVRNRIPVGVKFSASIQAGPGAHAASYTMGTGSFPGVKQPGHGIDHPPLSSTKVEGKVELYICSFSGPLWPVLGRTLPLPFTFTNKGKHDCHWFEESTVREEWGRGH